MFQTLTLKEKGNVGVGGNQREKIIGIGTIGNYYAPYIENGFLVDGLKLKLLNISQLCYNGYEVVFDKNKCIVINPTDNSIFFFGKGKTMFIR